MINYLVTIGEKYHQPEKGKYAIRLWEEGVYDNHLCFWASNNKLPVGYEGNELDPKDKFLTKIAILCFYDARLVRKSRVLEALRILGIGKDEAIKLLEDKNSIIQEYAEDDKEEEIEEDVQVIEGNKINKKENINMDKATMEMFNKIMESNAAILKMNEMMLKTITSGTTVITVEKTEVETKVEETKVEETKTKVEKTETTKSSVGYNRRPGRRVVQ